MNSSEPDALRAPGGKPESTCNQLVVGSNPTRRARFRKQTKEGLFFFLVERKNEWFGSDFQHKNFWLKMASVTHYSRRDSNLNYIWLWSKPGLVINCHNMPPSDKLVLEFQDIYEKKTGG